MNYVYNGFGEQVRKYLNTTNTYTVYDEAGQWLGDYGNAGNTAPSQQVIWMDDLPVGVLVGAGTNQKLHYIEPDALGTPRAVVDRTRGATGTTIWSWALDGEAFGTTAPNQNPDGDATNFVFNMRFPGQRYDSASGLNYNYFRDYEPATGRYPQSDPIGLAGGISTYGYVSGNPLTRTDPTGLADPSLELYAAGVIDRMPDRGFGSAHTRTNTYPALIFAFGGGGGPLGQLGGEGGLIVVLDSCKKATKIDVFGYGEANIGVSAIPASMYVNAQVAEVHANSVDQITGWGWSASFALANPTGGVAGSYSAPFFLAERRLQGLWLRVCGWGSSGGWNWSFIHKEAR
jgi:RHS repeat-associated protein